MRIENLSAVDLNLLVALDALLAERSVSRAATRVGLSQPAMSRALARLRDLLDDPVLVRSGREMVPTARVIEAQAPLQQALEAVRRVVDPAPGFAPAESTRSFRLSCVDTTQVVVLPRLVRALARDAPGVALEIRPLVSAADTFRSLGAGELDLVIGRFNSAPTGIRQASLYTDRLVCLARARHPRVGNPITLEQYVAEAHLAAEPLARADLPMTMESALARHGLTRRVVLKVANHAIAPLVVSQTDLLCTALERMIRPLAASLDLQVSDLPVGSSAFELQLIWHDRLHRDPAHRWLREEILGLYREDGENSAA